MWTDVQKRSLCQVVAQSGLRNEVISSLLQALIFNGFAPSTGLQLTPNSPFGDVLVGRVAMHFAATVFQLDGRVSPFMQLMTTASFFLDGYLISMPPNIIQVLVGAVGPQAGVWICSCGYYHLIENCNIDIPRRKCPQCPRTIGELVADEAVGTKPRLLRNTGDNSAPRGYVSLQIAIDAYRGMHPIALKVIRFFLHASLWMATCTGNAISMAEVTKLLAGCFEIGRLHEFLANVIREDFVAVSQALRMNLEDSALFLHFIIDEFVTASSALDLNSIRHHDRSEEGRAQFESWFTQRVVDPVVLMASQRIARLRAEANRGSGCKIWQEAEENHLLDLNTPEGIDFRKRMLPNFFLRPQRLTVQELCSVMQSNARYQAEAPLLYAYTLHLKRLRPIQHLSDVLRWHELAGSMCARRYTREEARKMPITDFLGLNDQWLSAWQGSKAAWNYVASLSRQRELELHHNRTALRFNYIDDDAKVTLAATLASNVEEGLNVLELVNYLVHTQNAFLDDIMAPAKNLPQKYSLSIGSKADQSAEILPTDLIRFPHTELLAEVNAQLSQQESYGQRYDVTLNVRGIERFVINRCLRGCRLLQTPASIRRGFQYSGEFNRGEIVNTLKRAVPQDPQLPVQIRQLIEQDIDSPQAQYCAYGLIMKAIELLADLSSSSADSAEAKANDRTNNEPLIAWMKTVQQVTDDELDQAKLKPTQGGGGVHSDLCLRHLLPLLKALEAAMFKQDYVPAWVLHEYWCQMEDGTTKSFTQYLDALTPAQLRLLKLALRYSMIRKAKLPGDVNEPLKNCVNEETVETDSDKPPTAAESPHVVIGAEAWFQTFPRDVTRAHWAKAYELVQQTVAKRASGMPRMLRDGSRALAESPRGFMPAAPVINPFAAAAPLPLPRGPVAASRPAPRAAVERKERDPADHRVFFEDDELSRPARAAYHSLRSPSASPHFLLPPGPAAPPPYGAAGGGVAIPIPSGRRADGAGGIGPAFPLADPDRPPY